MKITKKVSDNLSSRQHIKADLQNTNLNTYSHTKVKYINNNIKLNDKYQSSNDNTK